MGIYLDGIAGVAPNLGTMAYETATNYFKCDCTNPLTGLSVLRNVTNSYIFVGGGTGVYDGSGSGFLVYGKDHVAAGSMYLSVTNAAKNANINVVSINGNTDLPSMSLNGFRITNVAEATTAADALRLNDWAAWTPTLTWATGTPASVTTYARWSRIGKTIFFMFTTTSADANGCTGLTVTLPVASRATSTFENIPCMQQNDTTWLNPLAYIDTTNSLIKFINFATVADGKTVTIHSEGFYEIS